MLLVSRLQALVVLADNYRLKSDVSCPLTWSANNGVCLLFSGCPGPASARSKDSAPEGDRHVASIILHSLEDRSDRIVRSVRTEHKPFVRVDEPELQLIKQSALRGLKGIIGFIVP